jgi:hypothetical protein
MFKQLLMDAKLLRKRRASLLQTPLLATVLGF